MEQLPTLRQCLRNVHCSGVSYTQSTLFEFDVVNRLCVTIHHANQVFYREGGIYIMKRWIGYVTFVDVFYLIFIVVKRQDHIAITFSKKNSWKKHKHYNAIGCIVCNLWEFYSAPIFNHKAPQLPHHHVCLLVCL